MNHQAAGVWLQELTAGNPVSAHDAAVHLALRFQGHRLQARRGGEGPALWLIHGFPTSSRDWRGVWPALAEKYELFSLDMLGFGTSAKPRGFAYSIAASADQWVALAEATGVGEVAILAHDYGNTVAQELLARQREGQLKFRITSVAFLNGGLFPEATHPLRLQRLLASPLGPLLARLTSERRFTANLKQVCARPWPDGEMAEAWQRLCRDGGKAVMPKLLRYIAERRRHRERWVHALLQAGVPIALINGLEDPISGRSIVARWRELLPAAPVFELPGVGHYPQVEAPEEVLAAYGAFVGAL
ncbi:MAG: alpha/beta hydrolase [Arenimonas sp.]|uniref:alpha/beta fold hydrolase n=1 Tax=Arenimonas sp. TaxID=1872635 RepID=UPI0025B84D3A|nr:alpha/beta fold hydrolase [Arenimonas sp.]MBW8369314.1 alpha/beta hydrolase [Arenimonas sp.]